MFRNNIRMVLLAICCSMSVEAQSTKPTNRNPKKKGSFEANLRQDPSLYERMGGKKQVAAVVSDWITLIQTDPRINLYFKNTSMDAFSTKLTTKICQLSGGGCKYQGLDMRRAHMPGVIKRASGGAQSSVGETEFNAMIENLTRALDKHKIAAQEKTELIALMGQMKEDVIGISTARN
jgi:hemoglobin